MAEVFDEIKALLSTIKSKTKIHINEFRSFRDQVEGNLMSVRADLSSLNDSVSNLSMSLQEHKQQTAAELAQLQTSLNTTQSSLETASSKLDVIDTGLSQHKQQTAAELAQLQTSLQSSLTTHTQQVNAKLNTLTDSLSQHQQQTASSLETASSKLDLLTSTTAQLSTGHQQILANISDVECVDTEESSQLHQNLQNNLTHQLETIQSYVEQLPVYTCGGTGGWRRVVYLDID